MASKREPLEGKVALVTGGAQRIGAAIVQALHAAGMQVALHYNRSHDEACALARALEDRRARSVHLLRRDLLDLPALPGLIEEVADTWGGLDLLVNNASTFYPTPLAEVTPQSWADLMGTNLAVPLFLSQAAATRLRARRGSIVNIVDIHARRPLAGFAVYSAAKAGLLSLTRSLAAELGPEVRVNGVSPGAILWSAHDTDDERRRAIVARTALGRTGDPGDIARAVLFLARDAGFVSGQVLEVDGGRDLVY